MDLQADLFTEVTTRDMVELEAEACEPMAAPCAWRDAANKPCRRLGHEPVLIEGKPFVHRGRPLVHCVPECFRVVSDKPTEIDDGV